MSFLFAFLFTIVSYNCENLFDCRHDDKKEDTEFLPESDRKWTFGRYWQKVNSIGRVIHQCGENGTLPDIVGLVEVENDSTLVMLTRRSMLAEVGYRYIMTDSPDRRGVDVALVYNPFTFLPDIHYPLRVTPLKGQRPTRDILYVRGRTRHSDTLHVFVVHAPSRGGGQKITESYRMQVVGRLLQSVDSIRRETPDAKIVLLGDYNDYSSNKSLKTIVADDLIEISHNAKGRNYKSTKVLGTYKYKGRWDSLDHIFISLALLPQVSECFILDNTWLLEKDTQGGFKPFRTYLGPIYHNGVSDHLPLVLRLHPAE